MRGYLVMFCCFLMVLVLSGCNWFGKGLLNVINPEAEVRMYYVFNTPPDIGGPEKFELLQGLTFDLVVYPLNGVGFTIERLTYTYTTEKGEVAELAKDLVLSYYVPPNVSPEPTIPQPGEASPYVLSNLPLFFQDTIDYLWKNYGMKNLFLTLKAFLRDDAGHTMTKTIVANFPVLQLGEDFWPPTEVTIEPNNPSVSPGTTLTFLARAKDESTIVSYQWFVNGRPQGCAGGTPTFTYTFTEAGTYTVMVKVCDRSGNCSFGLATVTVTAA